MSKRLKSFELVASGEYDKQNKRFVLDEYFIPSPGAIYFGVVSFSISGDTSTDQIYTANLILPRENDDGKYYSVSTGISNGVLGMTQLRVAGVDVPKQDMKYIGVLGDAETIFEISSETTIHIYRLS